ncbi:MAG: hypothetical protein JO171_18665 [Paludibacterium sp.]|uniref:hypothetical protein n=1 Tax=Paludibacterium sp. TaxID=1917523 RepID=UPI0025F38EED|nr:hypothetical protein [Paludibacterium sp.]MBV8049178.1 hypothetical protein [Paludibacterium sp.]MBV8646201.1 hypothetical protein [Paludibacterium sp.]
MGEALKGLLDELEACRGEDTACKLLLGETPHSVQLPMDGQTCHELKALAEVFGCEPAHLGFVILRSALKDIHAGLDDDLDALARSAREAAGSHCCF